MTIQKKLYGIMLLSVMSILLNIYIVNYMLQKSQDLNHAKAYITQVNVDMKELTLTSAAFLEYKEDKYTVTFEKNYLHIQKDIQDFHEALKAIGIETKAIKQVSTNLEAYKTTFASVVVIQKKIGYSQKEGLNKLLHDAVRKAELYAKRMQNQDIYSMVLTLRTLEKSFLITHNKKYIKKFARSFNALVYYIQGNIQKSEGVISDLNTYKMYFNKLAKAIQVKGINSKEGLLGQMNNGIQKNDILLKKMLQEYIPILEEKISAIQVFSLILQLGIGILIVIALVLANKSIVSPIKHLIHAAKELTDGDGDLTKRLSADSKDEISQANHFINNFIQKVQTVLSGIIETSANNSTISKTLEDIANDVSRKSETQNNELNEVVSQSAIMRDDLRSAIVEAEEGKNNLETSSNTLEETKQDILGLVDKVQSSSEVQVELAESLNQLSTDASQVKDVLTVIADIADQTNLLALNAAIEAARAGEHGRGFAVVADEVRKLAERTQKSLAEINATINVIVQAIIDTSSQMNISSSNIEELATIAIGVGEKINITVEIMHTSTQMSDNILTGYRENAQKTDDIINRIHHISAISNENIQSIEDVTKESTHLHALTQELGIKLQEFKV